MKFTLLTILLLLGIFPTFNKKGVFLYSINQVMAQTTGTENEGTCNSPGPDVCLASVSSTQTLDACHLGRTWTEGVTFTIAACRNGDKWNAVLISLTGNYSQKVDLGSLQEVTGPGGNTTTNNFCDQIANLKHHFCDGNWYMKSAVQAHEDVHLTHFEPSLRNSLATIELMVEELSVPNEGQDEASAISAIECLPGFDDAKKSALNYWWSEISPLADNDHNGATETAEQAVVDPMINSICQEFDCVWCPN